MGSIRRRLEDLEQRTRTTCQEPPQRTETGRMLFAWLDEHRARKANGTLTPEDEEFADYIKAEVERRCRREAGLTGGGA